MTDKVFVRFEPEGRRIATGFEANMLNVALENGVNIRSDCGGQGICGKCKVIIEDQVNLNELTRVEEEILSKDELKSGYRLACQIIVKGEVVVNIPEESRLKTRKIQLVGMEKEVRLNPSVIKFHVTASEPSLTDIRADVERLIESLKEKYGLYGFKIDYDVLKTLPDDVRGAEWDFTVTVRNNEEIISVEAGDTSDKLYGVAIDIGTSKLAGYLIDLTSGSTIGMGAVENPQLPYGEDIISRISFVMKEKENLLKLQKLVLGGINTVIEQVCKAAKIKPINIYELTVVGNTIMHHLCLGIQPKHVALSPFIPAIKQPLSVKAKELKLNVNPNAIVYVLPNIAGFVGADAVGDVIATGIYETEDLCLLIDIGTNTEIFLGNKHDIISCSCASGPAFEGFHIKHGVKAFSGAIEKVKINPKPLEVKFETIGDEKPIGICGSGIVDCVAELFKCRFINIRGRFSDAPSERLRNSSSHIRRGLGGIFMISQLIKEILLG